MIITIIIIIIIKRSFTIFHSYNLPPQVSMASPSHLTSFHTVHPIFSRFPRIFFPSTSQFIILFCIRSSVIQSCLSSKISKPVFSNCIIYFILLLHILYFLDFSAECLQKSNFNVINSSSIYLLKVQVSVSYKPIFWNNTSNFNFTLYVKLFTS